jgi:hypothetical protein
MMKIWTYANVSLPQGENFFYKTAILQVAFEFVQEENVRGFSRMMAVHSL